METTIVITVLFFCLIAITAVFAIGLKSYKELAKDQKELIKALEEKIEIQKKIINLHEENRKSLGDIVNNQKETIKKLSIAVVEEFQKNEWVLPPQ